MTQTDPNALPRPRRDRIRRWPLIVVAMLMAHASLMVGTILYVGSKHDTWVQPDYYARAVDWDGQRKLKETPADLGWSIDLATLDHADNTRDLRVTLTDADGLPIEGAVIEVQCVHPAHIGKRIEAALPEIHAGIYASPLALYTPGYWQATLSIRSGDARALVTREFKID